MVLEQHQLSQRRYLKQQRRELKRSSQNKPEVRQRSLKYYKIRSLKITRKTDRGMYETKTLKNIRATERWDSEQKRTNYRHHVDTSSLEITSLSDILHSESTVVKSYILYKSSRINIRRLENRGKSARTTRVLELGEITQTRWRNLKNRVSGKRDNPVSMIRESRRTNRKYGSQVRAVEIRKLKYSKGFGRLRVEKYDNIQRYCSEIRALESRRSRNMCYPEMIVNVNRRTFETNEPREIIVKNSRIVNSRNSRKVVNYHDLTRYTLENQRTTKEFEFLNQEKTAYNLRLPADKINKDILLHKELGHSAKLLVLGSEKRNNEVLSAVHSDQDEGRIFSEMKHRTWTLLGIPVVTTTVLFVASVGLQPNMKSFEL
ncbi:uncharacterized protein LOC143250458 [Tachypleus tridentatus]|uniref:uncharacterized protein LOC143250458 n=1 Tax=Tachypleus tridentatus TaxID=6853 RepID=UPI003FD4CD10